MSAAHQFGISHMFVHKGKRSQVVLRGTSRLSASSSYELAGLSPSAFSFFPKALFFPIVSQWKMEWAPVKELKNMGEIKYSYATASIFILACIMRFAQNSSVRSQTEMSALGLSGWPCGSQMHANIPTKHRLQHADVERDTQLCPFPVSLQRASQALAFCKVTPLLYL